MAESMRDPRAFKVLDDDYGITFPKDDDVLVAQAKGDRPQDYAVERYRTGQTIPPGRLPLSASSILEARGIIEAVEPKGKSAAGGQTPAAGGGA